MNPAPQKIALITGAARRLGRAIALGMAADGWDIVVHYRSSLDDARDTVRAIEQLGRRAALIDGDLADESITKQLLHRANHLLGPVGCVVNNASLFEFDDAGSFSGAMLNAHMQANLAAPIILAQSLHALTPAGQQSVVINLLDQKLLNLNPDFLSYTLSKAGLHTATTVLAQALAPTVRVVGVAPGLTLVSGDQTDAGFSKAHQQTPLGKSSTPADIADAVCYLARAQAVTGTILVVDGGQHLIPTQRDVMFLAT
jgi:NAD(P)-dependent dehydrogenase (short-subunit alcohol dehydrogenase family)